MKPETKVKKLEEQLATMKAEMTALMEVKVDQLIDILKCKDASKINTKLRNAATKELLKRLNYREED